MAFDAGAIVSRLELNKKNWDASIKSVKGDQKSLAGFALRNEQQFKKMGKSMTIAGGAILAGLGVALKAFSGFDKSMNESLAIMGKVSDGLKKEMADAAKEWSTKSTFAAKELGEAYFFLASAGMDAEQSIKALGPVTRFAQAGAFDLATATDLLTDAQTALGLSSKDPIKNQKQMVELSDRLVMANTLANASVQQFSEALTNKAAAALVNVNKGMEEGIAVLAAYADKGIKGQIAGQRLTMMINGMTDAQQKNGEEWDRLGIQLFDNQGEMRNIGDLVGDMEGLLGNMTTEQKAATLATLGFNLKTKDSILTLMGSSEKIKEWEENLKKAGGTTENVANKQMESFSNKMTVLKNKINVSLVALGEKLAPTIEKLGESLGKMISKITKWIGEHPKLTGIIVKGAAAVGGLLAVLGPLLFMLPNLVKGIKLIKTAMTASRLATMGWMAVVALSVSQVVKLIKTLKLLKKAREEERKATILNEKVTGNYEKKLRGILKTAGLTTKGFDDLKKKYDGNVVAMAHAIKTGKETVELQNAMAEHAKKTTEELKEQGVITEDLTGGLEDLSGEIGGDLMPTLDSLTDLAKEMTREIKEATLDEFEYRVWAAEETYKERREQLENEGAASGDFVLLERAHSLELKEISDDRLADEKTKADEKKELWRDYWETLAAKEKEYSDFKKGIKDVIDGLVMDEFELREKESQEWYEAALKNLKDNYADSEHYAELKELIEKGYSLKKLKIEEDRRKDAEGEMQKEYDKAAELMDKRRDYWDDVSRQMGDIGAAFFLDITVGGKGKTFGENWKTMVDGIKSTFLNKAGEMISGFIDKFLQKNVFDPITDMFSGLFEKNKNALVDGAADAGSASAKSFMSAWDKIAMAGFLAFAAWVGKNVIDNLLGNKLYSGPEHNDPNAIKKIYKGGLINTGQGAKPPGTAGPGWKSGPGDVPELQPGWDTLSHIGLSASGAAGTTPGASGSASVWSREHHTGFAQGGEFMVGPNSPVGFIAGEGTKRERVLITPEPTGGGGKGKTPVNIVFNNTYNIPKEIGLDTQTLKEMFDRNADEMTEDIKKSLDRYA